jgi:rRNA 2'-O-methyltransferase fibrillarin
MFPCADPVYMFGLISIFISQNEDGTEVEYRVCDPSRSKLGAAILGGVTNIWIVSYRMLELRIAFELCNLNKYALFYLFQKPSSRVMYVGNVCGLTVSDLSDLVGLVSYVVYCRSYIFII